MFSRHRDPDTISEVSRELHERFPLRLPEVEGAPAPSCPPPRFFISGAAAAAGGIDGTPTEQLLALRSIRLVLCVGSGLEPPLVRYKAEEAKKTRVMLPASVLFGGASDDAQTIAVAARPVVLGALPELRNTRGSDALARRAEETAAFVRAATERMVAEEAALRERLNALPRDKSPATLDVPVYYATFGLQDNADGRIAHVAPAATALIDAAWRHCLVAVGAAPSCGVLVHCLLGMSRSVSVLLAYVIARTTAELEPAHGIGPLLEAVRRGRPQAQPQPAFAAELAALIRQRRLAAAS